MESKQCDSSIYLDCWLATASDWFDPAELHNQQDQDSTPSLPFLPRRTLTSPPSPKTSLLHSRPQKRKRGRSMNSDTASNASGETRATATSATSFQNRPILHPTPPSSRQRSPSPIRKVLSQLKLATPSLRVCQPDVRLEQPPAVKRLRSMLIQKLSIKVIPHSLQTRLQTADPDQFAVFQAFGTSSHLFEDPTIVHPASYTDGLWQMADKIYNEARRCYDNHLDESAWMKVVNNVLESAELGQDLSMLRVHSIQTQSIDPAFLPKHVSQSFAKKADLALAFSSDHPTVATAIEPVQKANPDMALSQMTDAYTSTVPLVCCLEVKERGGDYNEAIMQLGIWSAAGLERLRGLWTISNNNSERDIKEEELPPFLGWTVVGHDWKFHISWKDASGNVIVLGPWRSLNAGTSSHAEILILMVLIRTVKRWLEQEYWAWMCRNVLDGLK
ncbi:hypothetical protein BJ878DRAFT_263777 [Calycina marina]|uniref:PD-(D/E)XK nuclease-like domain-containing protein n=1 Tax=Calycina marina TaxID=1763456 RepID=A0A9P7YVP5_9HELO|nr:hypothetical protein BJ878DRAFT_263777 [Calycina marina]